MTANSVLAANYLVLSRNATFNGFFFPSACDYLAITNSESKLQNPSLFGRFSNRFSFALSEDLQCCAFSCDRN